MIPESEAIQLRREIDALLEENHNLRRNINTLKKLAEMYAHIQSKIRMVELEYWTYKHKNPPVPG